MPYRLLPFVNGEIYHLYNRGLGKQNIFFSNRDYSIFLDSLFYYQITNPKLKFSLGKNNQSVHPDKSNKLVEIICYCLMPNHFHLLVRQVKENGVSTFMRRFGNSYTRYINIKYNRPGPLFQGVFKAVLIETNEQLVHVSRYIHLNPLVANLVRNLKLYRWSSYLDFIGLNLNTNLNSRIVAEQFKSGSDYEKFVMDQADYGAELERIKHQIIDQNF